MIVNFHGKLAKDFGPRHEIEATSVADAIEGLTRQIGFYDDLLLEDRPVVSIVGHDTEESMYESPQEIDIVMAVRGGKGAGKILIGAALIGLAFTGVGAIAIGSFGTLGTMMFGLGVGLVLTGLSQMFIKAPSLSKSSDPEASKYLGLSNNTAQMGTLRSYSMGRIKLAAPHLLALNVDSTDLVRGEFPA